MPLGFAQYNLTKVIKKCLKLKKTLYGLWQSSQACWKDITQQLNTCGLEQSKFDPCFFCWNKGCVCCLCWWPNLVTQRHLGNQWLCNAIAWVRLGYRTRGWHHIGFLGVTLERDPEMDLLEMKQTGLIKRIIQALGLDDGTRGKFSPSEFKPLVKYANRELASGVFSNSSLVCMLLYLSGHSWPTITLLSIVVLIICSALNIHMSGLWNAWVVIWSKLLIGVWSWTPRAKCARSMPIRMQILPVCMTMRNIQILPAIWVGLDSLLLLQNALSCGSQSCRKRPFCQQWKPKSWLFLHATESCFIIDMVSSVTKSVKLPIGTTTMNVSIQMKSMWDYLCWQKFCLHSSYPEASITQSRRFGFVEKSSREVFSYKRLKMMNN